MDLFLSVIGALLLSLHHRPQRAERRRKGREQREKVGVSERRTEGGGDFQCLKTLRGKYLAPKRISLFDQRLTEREEEKKEEEERFELK